MSDTKKKILKYLGALVFVLATLFVVRTMNKNNSQNEPVGNQNENLVIIDDSESQESIFDDTDDDWELVEDNTQPLQIEITDKIDDEISTVVDEFKDAISGQESLISSVVEELTDFVAESIEKPNQNQQTESKKLDEKGNFYSKDDVALYIHTYKKLPKNFITKAQAEKLGWTPGVCLSDLSKGTCIGGDKFHNREGVLPKKSGRTYTECDIDTIGKKTRGAKRIVFSNDGLIYYTSDHYEHFDLLYGDE